MAGWLTGWLTGWLADEIQVNKIEMKVPMHLSRFFSAKAYCKVGF